MSKESEKENNRNISQSFEEENWRQILYKLLLSDSDSTSLRHLNIKGSGNQDTVNIG